MIQLKAPIPDELADSLECHFCEAGPGNWIIESIPGGRNFHLYGFFDTPEQAQDTYRILANEVPGLPTASHISELPDQDWKEAYKLHFKPWNCGTIHWVPSWLKETYPLPPGHQALFLDPGMAFGTGNHETTRLCLEGLVEYHSELSPDEIPQKRVVDAGCGSGILALSAALLGFQNIYAFDTDQDSIRICHENASANRLQDKVLFSHEGLDSIQPHSADLILANILAPVLVDNASLLLGGLVQQQGSTLILSGILNQEAPNVWEVFEQTSQTLGLPTKIHRVDSGIWSALICQAFSHREPS